MVTGSDISRLISGEASRKKLNRDAQKKWFTHNYFRDEILHPFREQRTEKIGDLVNWILESDPEGCRDWGVAWFERLLNLDVSPGKKNENYGLISGAYREKKLSMKTMKVLLADPTDDIPPVDLPFPTP